MGYYQEWHALLIYAVQQNVNSEVSKYKSPRENQILHAHDYRREKNYYINLAREPQIAKINTEKVKHGCDFVSFYFIFTSFHLQSTIHHVQSSSHTLFTFHVPYPKVLIPLFAFISWVVCIPQAIIHSCLIPKSYFFLTLCVSVFVVVFFLMQQSCNHPLQEGTAKTQAL